MPDGSSARLVFTNSYHLTMVFTKFRSFHNGNVNIGPNTCLIDDLHRVIKRSTCGINSMVLFFRKSNSFRGICTHTLMYIFYIACLGMRGNSFLILELKLLAGDERLYREMHQSAQKVNLMVAFLFN